MADIAPSPKSKKPKLVASIVAIALLIVAGLGIFTFNQQIKQAQGKCETALTDFNKSASQTESLIPNDFKDYAWPASFPAKEAPKQVSKDITPAEVQASLKDNLQAIQDLTKQNRSCNLKDISELKRREKQYSQDEQQLTVLTKDAKEQVAKYLAVATNRNQLAEQLTKLVANAKKTLNSTQHKVSNNDTRVKLSKAISTAEDSLKEVNAVKTTAEVQKLNKQLQDSHNNVANAKKAVESSHSDWKEAEANRTANHAQNQTSDQTVTTDQPQYWPQTPNYTPAPAPAPQPAPAPTPRPAPQPAPAPEKQSPQIPKGGGWVLTTEIEEKCLQGDTKGNSWEVPCD